MKTLSAILMTLLLAGCAGMSTGDGAAMRDAGPGDQPTNDMHRYADPSNIYYGG